jgi:hypothetical protein
VKLEGNHLYSSKGNEANPSFTVHVIYSYFLLKMTRMLESRAEASGLATPIDERYEELGSTIEDPTYFKVPI